MTINWANLRVDTNIEHSFEELCCQLARYEQVPENSQFIRKGTPDGGVECFWALPNNEEWGWQAKWFTTSPSAQQWNQIDESVENALEKHPNLVKYVVCLPNDRSDSRVEGQKTMLQKWDERVEKWKQIKDIDFEYWGTSEIDDRLSKEEHAGRRKYFFDQEFLSHEWFQRQLKRAIATAGPRYSPELNVKLPISKRFEVLGRTTLFFDWLKKNSRKITEHYDYGHGSNSIKEAKDEFSELDLMIKDITQILIESENYEQKRIPFEKLHEKTESASKIIYEIIQKLEEKAAKNREGKKQYERVEDFSSEIHHLWKLRQRLQKISHWTDTDSCLVANTGALLLRGNAGNGKTHLFCDVTSNRFEKHQYGVLLDGNHFVEGNPKNQILQELDLNCTFDEFLGALDTIGQVNNSKTLIMIDALNEGSGQKVWPKYLPELLENVKEYPWVGIALSVRTSYEPVIVPEHLSSEHLSKFTHKGFGNKTEEATKIFFEKNGIARPSVPLLVPEFSNPQFLLILCKGLKNEGGIKIPNGLKGLTSVYDFFINTINKKLSGIDFLDYSHHSKMVQNAVSIIAENMSLQNTRHLRYEEANGLLNQIYPSTVQSKSLLHHMISEGLLSEDLIRLEGDTFEPSIQFSYERLGDNLIVQHQLEKIKTNKDIPKLFLKKGAFFDYFEDDYSLYSHKGIIDAISIQLPEKFSKELIEVKPKFLKSSTIFESFIDSFMWRRPNSIKKSTMLQIEKHVIQKRQCLARFFKTVLTISADPEIILNGEYLHKYLLKLDLGDRDYVWSLFLHHDYYEEDSIVHRYIDWAWNSDKSSLQDESIYLAAMTLSWFLTSSNRFIRDRATKALVSLLSQKLEIFEKLLPKFAKCNDPYVTERLFCAAYGCVMKNNNKTKLKKLAQYTYDIIFKKRTIPPDILLRDYAKSIIDYVLYRKISLNIDYEKVEPPYNSKWIKSFPSKKIIEKLEKKHEGTPQLDSGVFGISHSLGHMGDFYRYTLGENSDSFEWSTTPLLSKRKPREKIFEEFEQSIIKKQEIPWQKYYAINSEIDKFKNIKKEYRKKVFGFTFEDNEFDEKIVVQCEKDLRSVLNKKQLKIFENYIVPYINLSFHSKEPRKDLNLDRYARWIEKKVFDLGWTKDRFGRYDTFVNRDWDRGTSNKPERMGKKYQWIAHSELLSRCCDNFEFKGDFNQRKFRKYIAPWQLIGGRDIDPSLLISKTFSNNSYEEPYYKWGFPFNYDSWDSKKDDVDWLKDSSDLPPFESILEVETPETRTKWLVLGGYFSLKQRVSPEKDPYKTGRRDIFFHLGSCIAKKSDISKLYAWGKKQGFTGTRFPKFDYAYDVFLGEYYWAKPVQHVINHGEPFWTKQGDHLEEMPAEVYVPMYRYSHESNGYDCSTDEDISIFLPNKLLVDKMNLINNNDGTFVNVNGEVIAYDPTIKEEGPDVLLIKKNEFLKFLNNNDYGIIWHVSGEKMIIGGGIRHEDWKGQLEIQGVYKMTNNKINGTLNAEFIDRKAAYKRNEERGVKQ